LITVTCFLVNSCINSLNVSGHASSYNNKVICAAVSVLTRTVCEITCRLKGVASECIAHEPGNVSLNINNIDDEVQERYKGITDFFLIGLIGIKSDSPESIKININNKEWYNGSQERWW